MAEDHFAYVHESFPAPTFSDLETGGSGPAATYDSMLSPRAYEVAPTPVQKSKKKKPFYGSHAYLNNGGLNQ